MKIFKIALQGSVHAVSSAYCIALIEIMVYTFRQQTCTVSALHALGHLTWV
jgi:hypothetical protein